MLLRRICSVFPQRKNAWQEQADNEESGVEEDEDKGGDVLVHVEFRQPVARQVQRVHNERCEHTEKDEPAFVEVVRQLACTESKEGAEKHEEERVGERQKPTEG